LEAISIIIVNWNGKKFLSECLEGLRRQTYQSLTITLVDNGSTDGSVDFVKKIHPEVRVICLDRNEGFSVANNIAIENVNNAYVALLNNDAVAHPNWLKSLVDALEEHPQAGFAASRMLLYEDRNIIDRAGDAYTRAGTGLLRGRGMPADNYSEQEWIFGACAGAALYRTQMLRDIGLFDEDFFLLYEDVDLSFRAQLKGYKCLYVPEAIVYHKASSSIVHDSPISVYYSHRNLEWVYVKNMPSKLMLKTLWLHVIYDIGAFFFFAANGRGKEFVKAKYDALKGLKIALKKRRQIQEVKTVSDAYIFGLLAKESFFSRWTRRSQRK
jgi:GT2 family glycosyltransferase